MAYVLTQKEKDAHIMMKNLLKKPINISGSDFKAGNMVMFYYNPKYSKNPYDATPLCLVLKRSKSYTLGLNFHWLPRPLRKIFVTFIYKQNKNNIKNNLPLEVNYKMIKSLFLKFGAPAIRLYINRRISPKGVVVPHNEFLRVIDLRSETFINITADEAWKMAVKNYRKKK